ncbi:uncharacterized protein CANTADRAFT_48967 [Suhomyces tanzawaensis NRRL Y-17324]|uniref:BTB domain-containing protein n=1 Tax=Suhomyces tanzawaensis NRRL Y-17324 TaxID=984487 RepID=A0A1E4SJE5_9ASCO|nr:uncharacterized protein CANTADRAFT_48967 [Suhomyces tanzawaensis NRRL Y-17324]ODV79610.1 hypothetical protein CANTADRAFT_48967 [Suhomyces tanzawaensis NRRL Y-17324]
MNKEDPKYVSQLPKFSKLPKDDLPKRDVFGRTILHLLILSNRSNLLQELLKNSHIKTIFNLCDYENGWNCMHYVIFYKRISCFRMLLDYFRGTSAKQNLVLATNSSLLEILKTKDRAGNTPLQLLDNDFKDLIWIPDYINEKSEFHISYRFKLNKEPESAKRASIKSPQIPWNHARGGSEVYMFGNNNSNQLGFGDSTDRSIPSRLSHNPFKKYNQHSLSIENLKKPRYKQVALSKYHSIILTSSGELFSCGKGSRGRLGLSNLSDSFKFQKIDIEDPIKFVSSHNNHTIAVTLQNEVYSWGLNNYNQLGYDSSSKSTSKGFTEKFELSPSLVGGDLRKNSAEIKGVATSKIHGVVFTKTELFFWGLNIGQMGFTASSQNIEFKLDDTVYKGEIQSTPRAISLRDNVKLVETCELCTFVVTDKNDIHVYFQHHHYKLPKIPVKGSSDKHFDIFKPTSLTKAVLIQKIVARSLGSCIILLDNGNVMSFSFNPDDYKNTKYLFVWRAYDHDMVVTDIDASYDGSIVLCTRNGSVFIKSSQTKQRKHSVTEISLPMPITKNKFKRLDNLNKVVQVFCDPSFSSFGFLRDDVDLLPLKLQKNDFVDDLAYLSCINDENTYRKQDQLLTLDHNYKTYVTNFFYPDRLANDEADEPTAEDNTGVVDLLEKKYHHKYDYIRNRKPRSSETYDLELNTIQDGSVNITNEKSFKLKFLDGPSDNRGFDCKITFKDFPTVSIGFHKLVLQLRSRPMKKLFDETNSDDLFVSGDFQAQYYKDENKLEVQSPINAISMALFIHFVYCNDFLDLNDEILNLLDCTYHLKSTFQIFDMNTRTLGILGVTEIFSTLLVENSGDVIVRLKDDEIKCHSFILKARSAYFETLLSDRWVNDGTEFLDFTDVSLTTFEAILKFIYGAHSDQIFDFEYLFDDTDEYINEVLELIEVADELLLFQLKSLSQVVLSDLINLDNVLILLTHADALSAEKLFMNCCWYIYNNLEILLFDPTFTDLSLDLMQKLEVQVIYFQNCKSIDFSDDCGVLNKGMLTNWFETDSDNLLKTYFELMTEYNEIFISDRKGFMGFKPLVDVKYELNKDGKEGKKKRDRKNSRRSSTVNNEILDFRNSIKTREKETYIDSSVLEEKNDDDTGFEVVNRGGRRKSKNNGNGVSPTPPWTQNGSASSSTTSLVSNIDTGRRPLAAPVSLPASLMGLSPFSNWASKSTAVPLFSDKPTTASRPVLETSSDWARKGSSSSKIKIGPMIKLSQKERKKKMAMEQNSDVVDNTQAVSSLPTNPWSKTNSEATVSDDLPGMPKLGSSKKTVRSVFKSTPLADAPRSQASVVADPVPSIRTPSLTEIMIEESLRVERARQEEAERKTLAEIQQEQEFAKWWEEETLRVQKQMGTLQLEPKAQPKGKPRNKKKPSGKEVPQSNIPNKGKPAGPKKKTSKSDSTKAKSKSPSPMTSQ